MHWLNALEIHLQHSSCCVMLRHYHVHHLLLHNCFWIMLGAVQRTFGLRVRKPKTQSKLSKYHRGVLFWAFGTMGPSSLTPWPPFPQHWFCLYAKPSWKLHILSENTIHFLNTKYAFRKQYSFRKHNILFENMMHFREHNTLGKHDTLS